MAAMALMRAPCDAAILPADELVPCRASAQPWILAATILASSMAFIDGTVVNVALPALQSAFHATVVGIQWVVESYGLFLSALILVGGLLGDLLGRRLVFLTGVALFAVASMVCGIASSLPELIIARCIQGVGAALLVPGSLAIISTSFDEKNRGKAIGTWSGFTAITTAAGPVLGGWLVQHASWRWVFFINLPLAVAVIAISLWKIPESRSAKVRGVDWVGAALTITGLAGIVNGFIESANLGWSNPLVWASLIIGFVCLIAFPFIEARKAAPIVPFELFKNSSFSGANLLTLFFYAAIGIFFFLLPLNLIQVQNYSSTATGAAILPLIVLIFLLSRWSGGLVARYGARGPLILGPIIAAVGFALFALLSSESNYWKTFFLPTLVLGLGMAVTVAPLTTVVMDSVDEDHVGTASGINNSVARVAGVLAVAVIMIAMVFAFRTHLNHLLSSLSLPKEIIEEIRSREISLAALQVPSDLAPALQSSIREMIRESFIYGFRAVMLICAALSIASAAVASLMIPKNRVV
jgi:EmrB/QacA subfamily drug resistance transporter